MNRVIITLTNVSCPGCPPKMDLVFIVDTSNSIPYPVLPCIRNLTADIVGALPVSPTDVQVAAIAYSSVAKVQFDLDDHTDKGAVEQVLRQTERRACGDMFLFFFFFFFFSSSSSSASSSFFFFCCFFFIDLCTIVFFASRPK